MTSQEKIQGFATPTGTQRYADQAMVQHGIPSEHFRPPMHGLTFSSMGIGTYLGNMDAETDALVTQAIIDSVMSGAVNLIDTAVNYRHQLAERCVGAAVLALGKAGIRRDELFISSKNGYLAPDAANPEEFRFYFKRQLIDTGLVKPEDIAGGMHCMSPAFLNHQLNLSLQNTGLETLDLMYLHNAAESQIAEVGHDAFMERLRQTFEFYEQARADNRIRYYGMATWSCFRVPPEETAYLSLESVVHLARQVGGENHGFRFLQLPFNLAFNEAATLNNQSLQGQYVSLLQAAYSLEMGVFTSVPLLQGQLLQDARLPYFDGAKTAAQSCIQLIRSHPGIIAPMVGQKHPEHVRENLQIAKVPPVSMEDLTRCLAAMH